DKQFYTDEAMTMLRDAIAKGYKDIEHLKKDDDLKPLREREDYKKLVKELEEKKEENKCPLSSQAVPAPFTRIPRSVLAARCLWDIRFLLPQLRHLLAQASSFLPALGGLGRAAGLGELLGDGIVGLG